MEKFEAQILENKLIAHLTHRLVVGVPEGLPRPVPGAFVMVGLKGFFLKRPLAVCDCAPGRLTLCYKEVGKGTRSLAASPEGSVVEVLYGLGNGFDTGAVSGKALLVGGGLGAAPLYLLCKELVSQGKKAEVVLGFNTASEIILSEEFAHLGAKPRIVTVDGSAGERGFVTDVIPAMEGGWDCFYTCGPPVMMKKVCGLLPIHGQVSLEERMGCGAGLCYGCTCRTAGGPARVCKEGPVFNKEDVIW